MSLPMNSSRTLPFIQQLAWIAFITVFQVLFLFLQQLYPIVGYWLTYFLPFFTMFVLLQTNLKGWLIYASTSILLIFISIGNPIESIMFFWLPSTILGAGYTVAVKQKFTLFSLVLVLSILQMLILFMIRSISFTFYEVDLLEFILFLFKIEPSYQVDILLPILVYMVALLQVSLSVILMLPLMDRFSLSMNYRLNFTTIEVYTFIGMFTLEVLLAFFYPAWSFFLFGPLTLMTIYSYLYLLLRPVRYTPLILILGMVLYPFLNAIFYDLFLGPFQILSTLFLAFVPLILMIDKSFNKKNKNALI
jgi:hypothetical protein